MNDGKTMGLQNLSKGESGSGWRVVAAPPPTDSSVPSLLVIELVSSECLLHNTLLCFHLLNNFILATSI